VQSIEEPRARVNIRAAEDALVLKAVSIVLSRELHGEVCLGENFKGVPLRLSIGQAGDPLL